LPRLYQQISADNDYPAGSRLEFTFPFNLLAELGEMESVSLTLKLPGGETRTQVVELIDRETLSNRA